MGFDEVSKKSKKWKIIIDETWNWELGAFGGGCVEGVWVIFCESVRKVEILILKLNYGVLCRGAGFWSFTVGGELFMEIGNTFKDQTKLFETKTFIFSKDQSTFKIELRLLIPTF